jgi:hypothetical protein
MTHLALLFALAAPAWACDSPTTADQLVAYSQESRQAFMRADAEAFFAAVEQLQDDAPCLGERMPPASSAQVYTALALLAFLEQDEEAVIAAFQSALAADPTTEVESWVPEMHPIHLQDQLSRRLSGTPATPFHRSTDGRLWVDGQETRGLVIDRPALIQLQGDGAILQSVLWAPSEPLPDWAPLAPERLPPDARRHIGLGAALAAGILATGALYAVSATSYSRYTDIDAPYDSLDGLQRRANLTGAGAIGAVLLSAGLGATLVLTW